MTGWSTKRFWTEVTVAEEAGGYSVRLDLRPVRTPGKSPLVVPTLALAEAIASEWARQERDVNPRSMPFTRLTNSVIDTVIPQFDEVAGIVSDYAQTDLLCYRAEGPAELVDRQATTWDPLIDWAADRYLARLRVTAGVIPISQSNEDIARLDTAVRTFGAFELAALYELVTLSGSLLIGLAVSERRLNPPDAWAASRIDEEWQIRQWGRDREAEAASQRKYEAFLQSCKFLELQCRGD